MKVHMIKDHGTTSQITDNTHRYYQCEHCSKSIKGGRNLERHVRGYHKIKLHKCAQCSYTTNRAYNLIEHKQTHIVKSTEDKQAQEHLCEECGELFSTASTLERHVKSTHQLSFKCDQCNKTLKCRKNLLRHVREQHEAQRFSCPHCNYHTNRKYQLSEHKKTHMVNKSTPKPKESITSQNVEQQTVTQPTSPSGPSNHDEENVPHFVTHWGGLTVYISGYPRLGKIDCMKL